MFLLYLINKIAPGFLSYQSMLFVPLYVEMLIALTFCVPFLKKRKFYWFYAAGFLLVYVGTFFLCSLLKDTWPSSVLIRWLCTYILYCVIFAYLFACHDERPIDLILTWTTIILIRETGEVLHSSVYLAFGVDVTANADLIAGAPWWINGNIYDLIHALAFFLLALLFVRDNHEERDETHIRLVVILSLATTVLTVVFKNALVQYANEVKTILNSHGEDAASIKKVNDIVFFGKVAISAASLILLFFRQLILKSNTERNENRTIHLMLKNEKKQYETLSDNMKTINMMTHDLKHQIENFQDRITAEEVSRLKSAVEAYDSIIKTGNDVIDTVIYEKTLYCMDKGIILTCNADGESCNFMKAYHLYSLLNNALGNAIEAAELLTDEKKKKIGITIYRQDNLLKIDCYNYFNVALNQNEKTTKENKHSHGFGVKSIIYVAKRYDGKVSITKDGDMFFLEIEMPYQEASEQAI